MHTSGEPKGSPYPPPFHEGRAKRAHLNSKRRSQGVWGIPSPSKMRSQGDMGDGIPHAEPGGMGDSIPQGDGIPPKKLNIDYYFLLLLKTLCSKKFI